MTNNPTIDGVSREDERHAAVKVLHDVMQSVSSASLYSLAEAVLDAGYAPAVEPTNALREHCKQCAEVVKTWPEWKQSCLGGAPVVERQPGESPTHEMNKAGCQAYMDADGMIGIMHHSSMGHAYVAMRELDPEVAALQSTIAQLQARIAELESGRGEPVAWVEVKDSQFGPYTFYGKEPLPVGKHELFTAPPAPVSVVLPERKPESTTAEIVDPDCLDATAALNGVRK